MPRVPTRVPPRGKRPVPSRELLIQVQVNRLNARPARSGADILASALVNLLVTLDGAPVDDLGSTTGDGTSEITLPQGWFLFGGVSVAAGGCGVDPTEFKNQGNGIYSIRVVPFLGNPECTWLTGDYVFGLQIRVTRNNEVLQGCALAKLTVL